MVSPKGGVESDSDVTALLDVLDAMYQRIQGDAEQGKIVFRQPVHVYDADKVGETLVAYLEELGYERLTSARNY
jgi:hypothetical protein